jgi:hypothetical protein
MGHGDAASVCYEQSAGRLAWELEMGAHQEGGRRLSARLSGGHFS